MPRLAADVPRRAQDFPLSLPSRRPRKRPRQERSRQLVEALLEATARILVRDGWEGLSTNRVAREAGVSVGSLYQYFPDKDALVSALIEGWTDQTAGRFATLAAELEGLALDECIRRVVALTLELTQSEAAFHRAVLLQLPRIGALEFFERLNRRAADALAEWISSRRRELKVEDPSLTAYVIVTSLDALTDHALLSRPELLQSPRFARELERLVAGCLGHARPARRATGRAAWR